MIEFYFYPTPLIQLNTYDTLDPYSMTLKLDENQQKAVEHFEGPALVVAGPGSGKTTVIKERILNLIQKHNVDPEHILAIAFTNAAVKEMENRFSNEPILNHGKPKICTLHVFGKDIIEDFTQEPNNIWGDKKMRDIIKEERDLLDQETRSADVSIYKIEDKTTHQCYIGQTTDPDRRKKEHFDNSSNRLLREAIQQKGKEAFDFKVIQENVKGAMANPREEFWINSYRNRSVVNLVQGMEQIARESSNAVVVIYKIKSLIDCTVYIGYTTDPESIRKIVDGEGTQRFAFEVICTGVPWIEADAQIANEIKKHKDWAVFNRQNPQKARYSNQLRIEMFCQYFNVPYDEVLESPDKFENLMDKFNNLTEDIEREKRQVTTGVFAPDTIEDPVLRAFAKKYEERKKEADAIDFLDMLIYSAYLLENDPTLRQYYRDKHRYVFVDEFQDISPIDFRLMDLFSENLFAVGDDDQAIYGFRGGDSSIMREKFGKRRNVTHYEITRNYRSTSTIVRHAKALIEHNPERERIPKNLRAKNPAQNQVAIFETPQKTVTVKEVLLRELSNLLTTDLKKVGILARNWKGEINDIEEILDFSELQIQGFEIDWEELGDPGEKNKRKMILRRGTKEIEILNIYAAKGKEWEKVILLVNTVYDNLPDDRNDLAEERRLFYVAVTRAERELVVLDGGNCQFISEFRNAPPTKEELEEIFKAELAAREPKLKKELEEVSKAALVALEFRLKTELEEATKVARKQHEPEIKRLWSAITEDQNEAKKMKLTFPQQLKSTNDVLLEGLIPVLDEFESNDIPADLVPLTEDFRRAHVQLLDSLKSHGLKPIEALGEIFNPDHHEEILPAIYSDEVQAGWVAREERRGYLLHNQVIRKAQVIISKGENIRAPERLDQVVEIYLHRLIFAFQAKYELSNIDQHLVKQEMVKYLLELGDESIHEIVSFSSKSKAETIQIKRYADYCAGLEKVHRCTEVFRDFWNKIWEVIKSLDEGIKQADTFLSQDFAQPVRFVTYAGILDLSEIETLKDGIKGFNPQGEERELSKLDVLFAFPRKDMETLKSHIKKKPSIADQKLQPIELISERFHIADDILKSLLIKGDIMESDNHDPTVQLVTRSGHVLNGHLRDFDEDFIYMNINKKDVIVYRAGILDFKNLIWIEITKAYKNGTPINGHVTERMRGGLRVKSRSLTGFLPASQVELYTVQQLDSYIGKTYEMMVIEINKANNHFVLSRRAWLKEQNTKFLNSLSEISKESPELRDIKLMNKTVEAIPMANGFPLAPETQHIPLYEPINLIVPEPVEKVVNTPPPMSKEYSEIFDTCVQELKPETLESVETGHIPLYEPIDLIVPEPVKGIVDSQLPMPKDCLEIPNSQIQNLKPEISDSENPDNITQEPTLETEVDREIPVVSTALTRSDSSTKTDRDARQIKGQDSSENEVEDMKKGLAYYLRRGGRFAVEKIKATIFRKPSS